MNYFKRYQNSYETEEITKEEARKALSGWWREDYLDDIFKNDRAFQLYTPTAFIWTKDENGRVPQAGFYGTVG